MLINAYCTVRELPELSFDHLLRARRDLSDPAMPPHLESFVGYLYPSNGEMTAELYALLRHVQRVSHQLSLEIDENAMEAFGDWLNRALGVAFLPDGSVRDPQGRRLFAPGQPADRDAELPISRSALKRKVENDAFLAEQGVRVPPHLPTVISEEEVRLRSPGEVARRALALVLTAVRAEALANNQPIPAAEMKERNPVGFASLSPVEQSFFANDEPSEEMTVNLCWRYESLLVLLWALGLAELPPPTGVCDVPTVVGTMLDLDEDEMVAKATLRPTEELLDALDLHYRAHWAVRQASLQTSDPPAGMIGGVVFERHYALNWLTYFENSDWDEVETPT